MGIIKEANGIDFIIHITPLTEAERIEISEFIRLRKLANKRQIKRTIRKKTSETTFDSLHRFLYRFLPCNFQNFFRRNSPQFFLK